MKRLFGLLRSPFKSSKKSGFGGFTVLEVMVALLIIGVLALLTIKLYLWTLDYAKEGKTTANIKVIATSLYNYATVFGDFPNPCGEGKNCTVAQLQKYLEPDYIRQLPTTDAWGHPLLYRYFTTAWDSDESDDAWRRRLRRRDEGSDETPEDEAPEDEGLEQPPPEDEGTDEQLDAQPYYKDYTFEIISFGKDGKKDSDKKPKEKADRDIVFEGSF